MKMIAALLAAALTVPMMPARAAPDLPEPFGTSAPEQADPSAGQAQGAPDPNAAPAPSMPDVATKPKPKSKSRPRLDQAKHGLIKRNVAVPARLRVKPLVKLPVNQLKVAEKAGFKKVSDLVNFPPFFPGLGIVTVKPDTLPVGPFRTFDRKGKLISTVYMLPLKDMDDHKKWDEVKGLPAPADHATFYFHPGHAGVDMPHYHLVIWHVSRKGESLVEK